MLASSVGLGFAEATLISLYTHSESRLKITAFSKGASSKARAVLPLAVAPIIAICFKHFL